MALAIYFILHSNNHWIVRFDDRNYGHNSLTSALRAAVIAARGSAFLGHEAEVIVQRPDRSWAVTWTSAEDFAPSPAARDETDSSPSLLGEGDRAKRGGGEIRSQLSPSTPALRAAVPLPEQS